MNSDLCDTCLRINKLLENGERIPNDLTQQVKNYINGSKCIGIAQINTTSGNIEFNAKKIANYIKYAEEIGLETIIFPEYALSGTHIEDAAKKFPIIAEENFKWLQGIAEITGSINVILGFLDKNNDSSIAYIKNGEIKKVTDKFEIINLSDEKYIIAANNAISEKENFTEKADLIINCTAVSTCKNDIQTIYNRLSEISNKYNTPVIFINQVGATDNYLYQGSSAVFKNGRIISSALPFNEQLLIWNKEKECCDASTNFTNIDNFSLEYSNGELEYTYKAVLQGIKDYFKKCGLKRAVLGISGGLDSSVCAVLLTDALGKENVLGISMPSHITTNESKSDAEQLALNLGINFAIAPIKPIFDTTKNCFEKLHKEVETLWDKRYKESYTLDNIQARARATYLWGICNEFSGCIPIATSDKSEAYMGYATINGDMSGGFAPIADITKTKLFALARWLNKNRDDKNSIPESIINKKPGAELAIDKNTGKPLTAEDALMPYEFLDEIIWKVENENSSYKELLNNEFIYEKKYKISKEQKIEWLNKFYKRMSGALYKWTIMPPSVILSKRTINSAAYKQPITSANINYNGKTEEYISKTLESI